MSRTLLVIIFLFAGRLSSFSQVSKMDELSNKLFFNIFIYKPDTIVYEFVKNHFPIFTESSKKSEWTLYPTSDTFPTPIETTYSLTFKEHPYFKIPFTVGRLDLLASEAKGYDPRIRDYQLWFMFNSKKQAEKAFALLSTMFAPLSKSKNLWSTTGKKIAEYCNKETFDPLYAVQFILTQDELHNNRYKIFFRQGAYTYK